MENDREDIDDRNDPKRIAIARALFGTCAGPDFAPDVTFEPPKSEPTIMRACCTSSECKGKLIRNRTLRGVYFITKEEAIEFAKIGKFEIPSKSVRNKYIVVANFCSRCGQTNQQVKLMKRSDFKLPKPY